MKQWPFVLCTFLLLPTVAQAFTTDGQEDICATAAVIMCENFENRPLFSSGGWNANMYGVPDYKNNGWSGLSADQDFSVVNTDQFDGTHAMQMFYPNGAGGGTPEDRSPSFGATVGISFTGGLEFYVRQYVKHSSNFVFSATADKWLYLSDPAHSLRTFTLLADQWGTRIPRALFSDGAGGWGSPPNVYADENMNGSPQLQVGQWQCVEYHVKSNTPGNVDGTYELWIDGTQTASYVGNVNFGVGGYGFTTYGTSGFWNCVNYPNTPCSEPASQHPDQYRWYDNIVVSTQRIGCIGSSGGSNPPPAPTGLTIK